MTISTDAPTSYSASPRDATGKPNADTDAVATGLRVAGYAALILFFELALIRYTAGYVRVFSFYLNFVLIATFLGMGVGLLRAGDAALLKWFAMPAALLLLGAIALFAEVQIAVPRDPNDFLWSHEPVASGVRSVPLVVVVMSLFTLTAAFFVPLGAQLGANFRKLPPLQAYSYDIAGSLTGIAFFGVLSALRQPPAVWFGIAFGAWLLLALPARRYTVALALTGLCGVFIARWMRSSTVEYWSPYYRINVTTPGPLYRIDVNGSLHQLVLDLDSSRAAGYPYARVARAGYVKPYALAPRLDTALVVGAGTGNDVALLLHHGAKHVDAVEIDPVIADLGRALHVQQPYADSRVRVHVDDARAYLRKTRQKYDVIVFGTLDSQTLLSGMSSVRLDNYVYTREAFAAARGRLADGGTLIVYHLSGNPYIAAKIYQMIDGAFTGAPTVFAEHMNVFNHTFVAGARRAQPPPDSALVAVLRQPHAPATDDWPYLYLADRAIPLHYSAALLGVLLIASAFVLLGAGSSLRGGVDGTMFLMGAGFLLIETKSVTEMSLLFGSTWTVNLLVFVSILVVVLVANLWVRQRRPLDLRILFGALFIALALAYVTPANSLLWLGRAGQWTLGGVMVALPILFASLIFSTLLRGRTDPTRALAYNLLGTIVGGVLEYASMVFGIKALYLLAALLYGGAWLLTRRALRLPVSPVAS